MVDPMYVITITDSRTLQFHCVVLGRIVILLKILGTFKTVGNLINVGNYLRNVFWYFLEL